MGGALLLALAIVFLFARAGDHRFLRVEDPQAIAANPLVLRGPAAALGGLAAPPRADGDQPLARLASACVSELGGRAARSHHLANVLVHALAVLLLLAALPRVTGARGLALFAAAALAVHPLVVEPVLWAAMGARLLAGVFLALVLLAHAAHCRRPSTGRYGLTLALFALGLLAHPGLAGLALLLPFLDAGPAHTAGRPRWRAALPFLALGALAFARAWLAAPAPALSFVERVLYAPAAMGVIQLRLLWPSGLTYAYPHPALAADGAPAALAVSATFLLGLVVLTVLIVRRTRPDAPLRIGWLWFVLLLGPAVLLPYGSSLGEDRAAYLALPGLFLVLGAGVAARVGKRVGVVAALLLVASWLAVGRARVDDWRDDRSLTARALSVTTANAAAHRDRAADLIWRGKLTAAGEELERALALRSGDPETHRLNATIELRHARFSEAQKHLTRALDLRADHVDSHILLGRMLYRTGDGANLRRAVRHLRTATELEPALVEAHIELGKACLKLQDTDGARDSFERALEIDPTFDPSPWWGLGIVASRDGRTNEAVRLLRRALEIEPDSTDALTHLGRVLTETGDLDGAFVPLSRAVEVNPRFADANFFFAALHEARGDVARAIDFYERTLVLGPRHVRANVALAWLYAQEGRHAEADRLAGTVLAVNPAHVEANELAARFASRRGDWEAARRGFRAALDGAPERDDLALRLGLVLARLGELDLAEERFRAVQRREPGNPQAVHGLGLVALGRGRLDEARRRFEEVLRERPDDVDALHKLGETCTRQGDWRVALEFYRRASEMRPGATILVDGLARLLAGAPDDEVRDGAEALRLARENVRVSERADPLLLETLAAAWAETEAFDEALRVQDEALGLAPAELRAVMEERRAAYARGEPWRLEAQR